jgi:hypothetical protein
MLLPAFSLFLPPLLFRNFWAAVLSHELILHHNGDKQQIEICALAQNFNAFLFFVAIHPM